MILIKLGGSVITHKDKPLTPNLKNLYRISRVIANYWGESSRKSICIIHGGGSFAHVVASQYTHQLSLTLKNRRGISLITWSARKLNDRVVESFVDYDLPVFPLQTSSLFTFHKKGLKMHKNIVKVILQNEWIPILYGDVILGEVEAQILSGERILEALSRDFNVERIIVCTNTPGVLIDKNKPDKGIFKSINPKNIRSVIRMLGSSSGIDVTGGMKEKVRILYKIAVKRGIRSVIIDGTNPAILYDCLHDQDIIGTWIEGASN